ncbi:hypothetical protein AB0K40_19500 [Nonomuraea bangladeshensis]|uniref:DUF11 domain-containing protein n=1 Tax=Nonomuraea bangladeshensis TaxID=404385 RepID=A0ABV3H5B1_9ACTN
MPGIAAVVALAVLGVGGGDCGERPARPGLIGGESAAAAPAAARARRAPGPAGVATAGPRLDRPERSEWRSWTVDRLGPLAAGEPEEMGDLSGEPGPGGPQPGGSGTGGLRPSGSGTGGLRPSGSGAGAPGAEREVRLRVRQEAMPATLLAGERATLRVTVTNTGPAEAADVTVTDTVDPALTPDFAALPDGCDRAGRAVTCGGPGTTLLPGQSLTYDLPITVDPSLRDGVKVVARAEATAGPEAAPAEVALLAAPVRSFADVELVLAAPPAVHAGDVIGYLLTVTNHGPARAADVTVRSRNHDPGATVTDRPAAECPGSGRTVACDLGDLAPGEVRTLALAIAPGPTVPFENCATVRTAGRDRDRADNRSCASTTVEPAPAPAELPPPPPARPEHPDHPEPPAEASYDEPPRQMDEPFAPAAAKGGHVVMEEEPGPAGEEVSAGLPMTGVSLWMLVLGVPVLLAIGLMVRFLDRQGRAGRAR